MFGKGGSKVVHRELEQAHLTLALEGDELCLTVSDDGVGFVPFTGRSTSFGVVGMRERRPDAMPGIPTDGEPPSGG